MSQTAFDFPSSNCYSPEEFIVSEENSKAFEFITNYDKDNQDIPKLFAICGPSHSGKTHLAHIWQKKFEGEFLNIKQLKNIDLNQYFIARRFYIFEDVDQITNQTLLFHIFNIIHQKNCYLLLTSSINLNQIDYSFKDLESRFRNVYILNIKDPDSDLIKMLLLKNFSNRQLMVEDQVVDFLVKNINRDFKSINKISKMLEFHCFEQKRKITIPLVKEVLDKFDYA